MKTFPIAMILAASISSAYAVEPQINNPAIPLMTQPAPFIAPSPNKMNQPQRFNCIPGIGCSNIMISPIDSRHGEDDTYVDAKVSEACEIKLQTAWDKLKEYATYTLSPNMRHEMTDVKFSIVKFDTDKLAGDTVYSEKFIALSETLCDKPDAEVRGVISHELGHMTSIYRSNEAKKIADRMKQYPNIVFTADEPTMEAYANQFGAQIYSQAGFKSDDFLAIIDKNCNRGNQYFCVEAQNWRAGLTY